MVMEREEVTRLKGLVEEEYSATTSIKAMNDRLTDFEDELFVQWDDECSRQMRISFSLPRIEDSKSMLNGRATCCQDADMVVTQGSVLFTNAHKVLELSRKIQDLLENATEYKRQADDLCNRVNSMDTQFDSDHASCLTWQNNLTSLQHDIKEILSKREDVY